MAGNADSRILPENAPVHSRMSTGRMTKADDESERLWTQKEAAVFLGVTPRYLRDSSCPKILLPGNGKKGIPVLRYDPGDVRRWARERATNKRQERRAS